MNPDLLRHLDRDLVAAVTHFWTVRTQQATRQGAEDATARDRGGRGAVTGGGRGAVTGGRQMDGFVRLVYDLLVASGLNNATISVRSRTELPGWFRPEKDWDLLVVADAALVAAIEFKSQVGPSFGNNFNNRTEEVLGSATDLWAAFRQGAFCAVTATVGRISDAVRRRPRFDSPSPSDGATLSCLPRVPRRLLRQAVRSTPDQIGSGAAVRFGLPAPLAQADWPRCHSHRAVGRTQLPQLRHTATRSGYVCHGDAASRTIDGAANRGARRTRLTPISDPPPRAESLRADRPVPAPPRRHRRPRRPLPGRRHRFTRSVPNLRLTVFGPRHPTPY